MPGYRRCRYRIRLAATIGILVATGAGAAKPAPAAGAPNITEPRNAATGFAITLWMVNIDALGAHCAKLGSPSDDQFMNTLKVWQERNMSYVNAALEYMADIEDFISTAQGEAARKQFRSERKAEFVASTRKSEAVWFPDGRIDEASCQHMAAFVANGSLDVNQNAEFFPILQTLKAEAEQKGEQ